VKEKGANPPYKDTITANLDYLVQYTLNHAYISTQSPTELLRAYKRRLYNTMYYYTQRNQGVPVMRIQRSWPLNDWGTTWNNLHDTPITPGHKAI
jgi:hypothetical protein